MEEPFSPPIGRVAPRLVNLLLGAWLIACVFLWRHDGDEGINDFGTGILVVTAAAVALWAPAFRLANVFLAACLLVTTVNFHHVSAATLVNDLAVGAAILVLGLVPPARRSGAAEAPA